MKFSILVSLSEDAGGLEDCLSSLRRLKNQPKETETILVGKGPALEMAREAKARARTAGQTISNRATLNEAIKAACGDLVAFLDSDTTVHQDWLARIDAEAADKTVGCFAGDILPLDPATPIEKYLVASLHQQQRWAVSGWYFKPYALFGNAVYRRSAFDHLGDMSLDTFDGAATSLAWRMLDRTDLKIRFVPQAVVYRRGYNTPEHLWSQFCDRGRRQMSWIFCEPEYSPPSLEMLEEATLTAFTELVDGRKDGGDEQLTTAALKAMSQTALLYGQLRKMLEVVLPGSAADTVWETLRERNARCSVCGSARFVPGPRGRMVGILAPQCAECGSLERHRVLHSLLSTMNSDERSKWRVLAVGEALPRTLRVFDQHHHATIDQLAAENHPWRNYDVAIATFALSSSSKRSIEDVLSLITSPLRENGMLILVDLPLATYRWNDQQVAGVDLERTIAQCLPNATVRSAWAVDRVTQTPFVVTISSRDVGCLSYLISKFCKMQFANDERDARLN